MTKVINTNVIRDYIGMSRRALSLLVAMVVLLGTVLSGAVTVDAARKKVPLKRIKISC